MESFLFSEWNLFCYAIAALRRSKKRVRAVINTEMPFLLSKEFSQDQENEPHFMKNSAAGFSNSAAAVEMHQARWTKLFEQMDKALCEEEQQLVRIIQ